MAPLHPVNGHVGKQAVSGLKNVKRDWSDSNSSQQTNSQGSELIEWPPSPERPPKTKVANPSAYEARVTRIQMALEAARKTSQNVLASSSSVPQKRLLESKNQEVSSVAKKRVLPASWDCQGNIKPKPIPQESYESTPSATTSFGSASLNPQPIVTGPTEDTPGVARIFLSNEQQQILKLVEAGNNVFFTGSAGTGKSVLLREIIKSLRKIHQKRADAVAITASTGIAACNIGGVTLHSFGGIGLGVDGADQLANKIKRNKKVVTRWLRTQVLIMDEISMVDGDLFDKLERIACILRKTNKPFGGMQLIVTGDFFQLPPVMKGEQVKFAFEAQKWSECIPRTFNLTKVFRQRDQGFVDMLNEMRFGRLAPASVERFKSLSRPVIYSDGIEPTELFPRREDVDRANKARMYTLKGQMLTYLATDTGSADPQYRDKQLANLMAPAELQLRIDSQVMLIKNTDETLVNGSMGRVINFVDPTTEPLEPLDDEERAKIPKSIGSSGLRYPKVRFSIPGQTGKHRDVTVLPETWKIEGPNGEVLASRSQLPLILAWAMSIHKSQGQTLERVKVNLNKVFEKGQAYVALSRATSLEGLEVHGFDPAKVQAHPKVAQWSMKLESFANA